MAEENTSTLITLRMAQRSNGLVVCGHKFSLEEVREQVQIPAGPLPISFFRFFSFIVFLPCGLFPFILTADPF